MDRSGGELTTEKYPSLGTVLDGLREKYGRTAGGKAGIELRIVRKAAKGSGKKTGGAAEDKTPDKTLVTLTEGTPGTVRTTLDAALQAEAERQVLTKAKSSVVLLRASTGEILAVANQSHGFNVALQGSLAPGSTMKIISSTLLFEKGLASAEKPHPCPKYSSYGGWKFQNDDKFSIQGGTFKASFARSCNTAFISQAKKLDDDDLTGVAQQVYGLGRNNWAIGVPSLDGSVPVQSGAQMAASLIGQGGVRMNPLNMASVVATAKTGSSTSPTWSPPRWTTARSRRRTARCPPRCRPSSRRSCATRRRPARPPRRWPPRPRRRGEDRLGRGRQPGQAQRLVHRLEGRPGGAGVVLAGGHGGDTAGPIVAALLRAGS